MIVAFLFLIASGAALQRSGGTWRPWEKRWLIGSLTLHVLAFLAQLWVTFVYYGAGDLSGYLGRGQEIVTSIQGGYTDLFDLLGFIADGESDVFRSHGSSQTNRQTGIVAMVMLLSLSSRWGACLMFALGAFWAQVAMYSTFRRHVSEQKWKLVFATVMLMPSTVFWASAPLKESVALVGMGLCILGLDRFLQRIQVLPLALVVVGLATIWAVKPYIVPPMAGLAAIWLSGTGSRAVRQGRRSPGWSIARAVPLGFAGILLFGIISPRFSLGALAKETADLQVSSVVEIGGSDISITSIDRGQGFVGLLKAAPRGFIAVVARPFPTEAGNLMAVFASIEITLLALLVFRILKTRGLKALRHVLKTRFSAGLLCFVAIFAIFVGAATTNLGSLARYRSPMLPLYATLLVVLLPPPRGVRDGIRSRPNTLNRREHVSGRPRHPSPMPGRLAETQSRNRRNADTDS